MQRDNSLQTHFNSSDREHIEQISVSILCTKWKVGYAGGSFVQAVVDNDLMRAISSADYINQQALPFYCRMIYNIGKPNNL